MEYEYDELLANADFAFGNKQYLTAMELYVRALVYQPENLYLLSRAGITGIACGKYQDALNFFSRAVELDPGNGDNYYNLGNAYYYHKDYGKCLEMYTRAEEVGCSTDVVKKLYFQKALLCGSRGDVRAALVYLDRYEEACGEDVRSIDPRIFSEKAKYHLVLQEYDRAEISAAKLVSIQPTELKNYLLYFGLLMMHKKYEKAERILRDAEEFAVSDEKELYLIRSRKAAFYAELASVYKADRDRSMRYFDEARELFDILIKDSEASGTQNSVKLDAAVMYMQAQNFDEALKLLNEVISAEKRSYDIGKQEELQELPPLPENLSEEEQVPDTPGEVMESGNYDGGDFYEAGTYFEEAGTYFEEEMSSADYMEDYSYETGELSYQEEDIEIAGEEYESSENGDSDALDAENEDSENTVLEPPEQFPSENLLERACYAAMSCCIAKEDYRNALPYARRLKNSRMEDYRYFAVYCEAFAVRSLGGEDADRLYAEAISFYRSEMLRNPKNHFSIVYRARMYAEQGSFVRAEEIAKLLSPEEYRELTKYIGKCREELQGNS